MVDQLRLEARLPAGAPFVALHLRFLRSKGVPFKESLEDHIPTFMSDVPSAVVCAREAVSKLELSSSKQSGSTAIPIYIASDDVLEKTSLFTSDPSLFRMGNFSPVHIILSEQTNCSGQLWTFAEFVLLSQSRQRVDIPRQPRCFLLIQNWRSVL